MRISVQSSPPEHPGPQPDEASNLIDLLCNEKGRRYFGRVWALKAEILAAMQAGSLNQSAIAVEYGVTKQAVNRLAKKARGIYGAGTARNLTLNHG